MHKNKFSPSALCLIAGVIVQFSTNNGVQWQFVRELDFSSFLEPQVVTIELPPVAKTPYTVFRWWQPQQGKFLSRVSSTTEKPGNITILQMYLISQL